MSKQLLMGNEAIAHGAIAAGVNMVCGYPGTPSTEVLETVAAHNPGDIHVEWSTNEKAALEVASGASISGARTMVTMKQVGLNVASDPLMTLAYLGVKGGMVVLVADDPGPISSQTEQDTRSFASFAKLPVFDPASPEEAYNMVADAFALSEKYKTPVIMRPTTRVCHACAPIEIGERTPHAYTGFEKDSRWIIFPKRAIEAHHEINTRLPKIAEEFNSYRYNTLCDILMEHEGAHGAYAADTINFGGETRKGIATGGISNAYALEALTGCDTGYRLLHVATPQPFPDELAAEFLSGLDEVLVLEELDPVIERSLLQLCGARGIDVRIRGKLTGDARDAGENTVEDIRMRLAAFFGCASKTAHGSVSTGTALQPPALPVRPPVLCAGCPHRGSFYATKRAIKLTKQPAICCGDIGCYTLGNAQPLEMVDTCLCMGGGITQAQGFKRTNPKSNVIAFVGDSTFFASGITGVVNAFYNQADITLAILDNSTTAMTGHQPHPGTGRTMMGDMTEKVSIEAVLRGIGLTHVTHANPLDLDAATAAMQAAIEFKGVSAVIFEAPCIALFKPEPAATIDMAACTNCKRCILELGCPAIASIDGQVCIDKTLCYGCNLCASVCPQGAILTADMASAAGKERS